MTHLKCSLVTCDQIPQNSSAHMASLLVIFLWGVQFKKQSQVLPSKVIFQSICISRLDGGAVVSILPLQECIGLNPSWVLPVGFLQELRFLLTVQKHAS